jgi:hypothetical protein
MAVSSLHGNSARVSTQGTGPVAVGHFVAPIAGKTLSRGGAAMAGLLSQWPAIAGPALAGYTIPAKMSKAAPSPALSGINGPSVLLLKVDPAKALEVQYAVPQLIERINQALGYQAVAGLRLLQAPIHARAKQPLQKTAALRQDVTSGDGGRLGNALARMAAGVGRSKRPDRTRQDRLS